MEQITKGVLVSSIKIISIPPGRAPERVRKEWVGLVIPLPEPLPRTSRARVGVFSELFIGRREEENYFVETRIALPILFSKSRDAAVWFLAHAHLERRIQFDRRVCEFIP